MRNYSFLVTFLMFNNFNKLICENHVLHCSILNKARESLYLILMF